jgi:hypothetical protein
MPKVQNRELKYRLRGFIAADGVSEVMVYGDGPVPSNADGSPMKLSFDQSVTQVDTVVDNLIDQVPSAQTVSSSS